MSDDWPDRIIDLTSREKAELMRRDSERYFRQVRMERELEALGEVRRRLDTLQRSTPREVGRLRAWWAYWLGRVRRAW